MDEHLKMVDERAKECRRRKKEASDSKLRIALDKRDIDQLRAHFQMEGINPDSSFHRVIEAEWLEGARYVLTEEYDNLHIVKASFYLEGVRCLDMFKLFAEFELDFQTGRVKLLVGTLDSPQIFDWLLGHGLDINMGPGRPRKLGGGDRDDTCRVLNEASARGDVDLFEDLVRRGADPTRSIALHTASSCRDPAKTALMMNHLLRKYDFDVNLCEDRHPLIVMQTINPDPKTPLVHAVSSRNVVAVEILLRHGANDQNQAFSRAVRSPFDLGMKPLLDGSADPTYCLMDHVHPSRYETQLKAIKLCLEYGADPTPAILYEEMLQPNEDRPIGALTEEMMRLLREAKVKWDAGGRVTDYSRVKEMVKHLQNSRYSGRLRVPPELQD